MCAFELTLTRAFAFFGFSRLVLNSAAHRLHLLHSFFNVLSALRSRLEHVPRHAHPHRLKSK